MQQRAEQQFTMLCDSLKLDELQQKEARKLFDNVQKERDDLIAGMRSDNLSRDEMREQMMKINIDYNQKFRALLNPEQIEKYGKIQSERPRRRPRR